MCVTPYAGYVFTNGRDSSDVLIFRNSGPISSMRKRRVGCGVACEKRGGLPRSVGAVCNGRQRMFVSKPHCASNRNASALG